MILHPERKDKRTTVVICTALYIPAFTFIFVNLRAELGSSFVHTFAGIYRINFSLLYSTLPKTQFGTLSYAFTSVFANLHGGSFVHNFASTCQWTCRCSILQKASVISFILKMSANITVIQKGKKQGEDALVILYSFVSAFTFLFVNLHGKLGGSFDHNFACIYQINFFLLYFTLPKPNLAQ